MFSVYCPTHGGQILLSSRHIESLRNTDHGIEIHWRCVCGTRGVEVSGRLARRADPVAASPRPSAAA
jgi:hypothetical protein